MLRGAGFDVGLPARQRGVDHPERLENRVLGEPRIHGADVLLQDSIE